MFSPAYISDPGLKDVSFLFRCHWDRWLEKVNPYGAKCTDLGADVWFVLMGFSCRKVSGALQKFSHRKLKARNWPHLLLLRIYRVDFSFQSFVFWEWCPSCILWVVKSCQSKENITLTTEGSTASDGNGSQIQALEQGIKKVTQNFFSSLHEIHLCYIHGSSVTLISQTEYLLQRH